MVFFFFSRENPLGSRFDPGLCTGPVGSHPATRQGNEGVVPVVMKMGQSRPPLESAIFPPASFRRATSKPLTRVAAFNLIAREVSYQNPKRESS